MSITPTEQLAITTAHAAVEADAYHTNIIDTAVLGVSRAGLLASQEQLLAEHIAGLTQALAHIRARAREVATPADLIALVDELLAEPGEVLTYRAEYRGIPLGSYWTRVAARTHLEDQLRRENRKLRSHWVAVADDPDRPDPDSPEDLWIEDYAGSHESGYAVVPVVISGEYDPDADE